MQAASTLLDGGLAVSADEFLGGCNRLREAGGCKAVPVYAQVNVMTLRPHYSSQEGIVSEDDVTSIHASHHKAKRK